MSVWMSANSTPDSIELVCIERQTTQISRTLILPWRMVFCDEVLFHVGKQHISTHSSSSKTTLSLMMTDHPTPRTLKRLVRRCDRTKNENLWSIQGYFTMDSPTWPPYDLTNTRTSVIRDSCFKNCKKNAFTSSRHLRFFTWSHPCYAA
jgi:hypothetical protein